MATRATKILFLTTILPSQRMGGGEVASQALIDGLRQNGCKVSVVGYMRKDAVFEPQPHEIVVEERYIETSKSKFYAILWLLSSVLMRLPYSAAKYYSRAYIKLVKSLLAMDKFDIIVIDHSQLGWLAKVLDDQSKIIFVAHNIERDIYVSHRNHASSSFKRWLYTREAHKIEALELKLLDRAAEVWTLTDHDASYFSVLHRKKAVKSLPLPPAIDKKHKKTIEKRFDIGLIGSWTWKFNEDGLRWFFEFVYPELPIDLSIHVAGKGADWLNQKYPNVQYEGFVPNAQVFMSEAKVLALPAFGGSGIQIKALEALASGSSIVATPTSMRGISFSSSIVKTTKNPQEFANFLSAEVNRQHLNKPQEDSGKTAYEWFKNRKESFLYALDCSVKNTS